MEVINLSHHAVSNCEACGELFSANTENEENTAMDLVRNLYQVHLQNSPKCQIWHDELPTLESFFGILK